MSYLFQNIEYSLYILSSVENMNFCHRGESNKRVTYISKFFVSGRSLNFTIASGLLSGSFSRIALPETVNKPECVFFGTYLTGDKQSCTSPSCVQG